MKELFGAHSLGWDTLLSLDTAGGTGPALTSYARLFLTPKGRPYPL